MSLASTYRKQNQIHSYYRHTLLYHRVL